LQLLDEVGLKKKDLILPVFVQESEEECEITYMPGIKKTSPKKILHYVRSILETGISSIILFGIPNSRDEKGSVSLKKNGVVQHALRKIKGEFGDQINLITDVCICQYNYSGHCGLFENGEVANDSTLNLISRIALSHVEAGADVLAPSSMMDGQVWSIRKILKEHGFEKTKIFAYSAKQSSCLYAPFRSATFSDISQFRTINKLSYQILCANPNQILREVEADIHEGADMVMVKPGIISLDIVCRIKEKFDFPVAVQNVSGEYAMVKAAAIHGWIKEEEWKINSIASIKRAGADKIISYFTLDLCEQLSD
jgi:porphobilinogen synthase